MIIFIAFIAMTVPVLGFVLTLAYFNQYKRALASALLCGLAFSAAIYGYIPDDGNDILCLMLTQVSECYFEIMEYHGIYILMVVYNLVSIVYTFFSNNFISFDSILFFNSVYIFCGMVYLTHKKRKKIKITLK